MLEIHYTGASKHLKSQPVGSLSLGGFISSDLIPNDVIDSLFAEISQLSREKLSRDTRVIAIKNITASTLTGFTLHTITDASAICEFTVGYQEPVLDDCGDIKSEKLPTSGSLPQLVTMNDGEGAGSAIALPDLEADNYLFIFVTRQIIEGIVNYTRDQLVTQQTTPLEKSEATSLVFTWD